jgi:riboflavin-specific deaminase-like protein
LLPDPADPVDPVDVYGDLPEAEGRPSVRLNMVASFDGATAVAGRSGDLSGPADQRLFKLLRTLADAVLVGATTVRTEHYGPAAVPIAVVTRSCRLDWEAPLFTAATVRPVILTAAAAPSDRVALAAEVADVVVAGDDEVDVRLALDALGVRGIRHVLCEGGPTLNVDLAAAGVVDEVCLTIAPWLVGGTAKRVLGGGELPSEQRYDLGSVCEDDGFLFLRYRKPQEISERTSEETTEEVGAP